ncbi:endopolygalacturonase PGa [Pseudomassariella vexata]|uniref:endo-polygalacturonase n=1 Tax=Pseudomassariella vexata TaxID=1141098 RepID=A0A1Y2DRY1_9PEZI|nr:endopolygalacturonase PGa [Pseudomassariella vexata]ORY61445.1 endopolygalacturonase PGa [Pseudomassariella vexata]
MVQHLETFLAALLVASGVSAGPAPAPTPAPRLEDAVIKRGNTSVSCTFSGSDGYLSANASKTACATIVLSALTVPAGITLDMEGLNDGTNIVFVGNTTFEYAEWSGSLFSVSGNNITVRGAPGSSLDGQGALYWDGMGNSGGVTKPKFFKANNLNNSMLDSVVIRNAPRNSFSLNYVNNLLVKDVVVDDSTGDALGKNTDGFNINNANNVLITGAKVWNQDDCVAINSGQNIVFTKGFCSGGHGLSIGSIGGQDNDNAVQNVTFSDTVMEKSQQSVRIKSISGANGTVADITYRNIFMSGGTDYGIIVDQSYNGVDGEPTNGVSITGFVLQNVTGTVNDNATNKYIECGEGSCSDWTWTDVQVTGGLNSASCMNVPEGISC